MDVGCSGIPLATLLLFLLLSAFFPPPFSAANQFLHNKTRSPPISVQNLVSSIVLPIQGNVYPRGDYTVSLNIGNRPEPYELDIDTGSDLTWVQCDAPCKSCTLPQDKLYKPHNNIVKCEDPLCDAVPKPPGHHCADQQDQCDYEVQYADRGSSLGVLVRDVIPLKSPDGTSLQPEVAFGCGYDQQGSQSPPPIAGVLGLGNGKTSILSQLHSQGLIRNVVGHCLSAKGGGFLFFGDNNKLIPLSRIVWTPIVQSSSEEHYNSGPADLFFDGKSTCFKGLQLIFDSGTSYTYFNSQSYKAIFDLISNALNGKPLSRVKGESLPICWKGAKPFETVSDVKRYFKLLALSFTKSGNSQFQLPPEAYLIISKHGNACLGILNGTEVDLGNRNIIGDISLQDKIVIYDNEKQQIGWAPANCADHPRS